MAFLRQTWTLTVKNLLIVLVRNWFTTIVRAFIAPIIFMFFISYAKNFFIPPSTYGVGSLTPLRSFPDALNDAIGNRNTVAFVTNGFTGGDIEQVINTVGDTVRSAGKEVQVVDSDVELLRTCRSTLRGVSGCYGAASFKGSPTEGDDGLWSYTIRADGAFGTSIFVDQDNNDAQIYLLPFQHAIDSAIVSLNGSTTLPTAQNIRQFIYTDETQEERDRAIQEAFMDTLIGILSVAFFVGVCGVTYQLTGHMASERELGMSQLIEAMVPNKKVWHTQVARLLSLHLAFDIIYLPGWIIMGVIVSRIVFPTSNVAIQLFFHVLAGFSLCSFSILGGSLFRKAQLSGITVTMTGVILAIISQVTGINGTAAITVLSLLFPPMNYVFFFVYCAHFEKVARPVNLAENPPNAQWALPGIVFWVFLMIQFFAFPVIGAFVERRLYGTASKERRLNQGSEDGQAIKLSGFSKHYNPNWWYRSVATKFGGKQREPVIAVNDLSLGAKLGEVLVLLGANGSGKSTTLSAITGLNTISEGSIDVDGTGGLGYCPQGNVMWDNLSVFEHVRIFNQLKATGKFDTEKEIEDLIGACDLNIKLRAKSNTLSGGQKRKLQLAMMFTGGSRVCCVDEISSGLDPLSRRKIWDILLAERGSRTMLLTTHFLDEADVLSDHIVILSKGNLKAEGSAVELKHRLGGGYRVILREDAKFDEPPEVTSTITNRQRANDRIIYQLDSSSHAAVFVGVLEKQGIANYQVMGPTIEDVFLKLAEEIQTEIGTTVDAVVKSNAPKAVAKEDSYSDRSSNTKEDGTLAMSKGAGLGIAAQTWILFRKRFTILRRNYLPYVSAVLIPIIAGGLVTLFLQTFTELSCDPGEISNDPPLEGFGALSSFRKRQTGGTTIPVGPANRVPAQLLATLSGLPADVFQNVGSTQELQDYINTNYATVKPGGFFIGGNNPTFTYQGNGDVFSAVLAQNLFNTVLSGVPITTNFQRFAVPFAPSAGDTLQLILYFGLAMCVYPGFFCLYPTMERIRKVRALHYSNGIRAAPLWLAYLAFDFLFVLLISAVTVIIFTAVSSAFYHPGYLFVVFMLYGLASIPLVYLVSLFSPSQLAAFAFAAGGQCCFFLIFFIQTMTIITYTEATFITRNLIISNFAYNWITPAGTLLRVLLLSLNEFSVLCRDSGEKISYPGDILAYGGPILYLCVQAIIITTFLIWWDSGAKFGFLRKKSGPNTTEVESNDGTEPHDPSVQEEARRIDSCDDPLKVQHVSKVFGQNTAVNDVSFGIQHSEVFALLGPNGAGKSTTISLIRGDESPSYRNGDVYVEGVSITKHRPRARMQLGVCPQFDAMDTMTVWEHLEFYARARGVPKKDVKANIETIMHAVGITTYSSRMAAKLSGGNKRKLSLAIALMGNPSVLLLDEPSSGMDAAAKRVMWKTLSKVTNGRALLITTHSMEEADALAKRAGIMAGKMLATGTTDALRDRFSKGWYVHLVLEDASNASMERMGKVADWVVESIPNSRIEGKPMHGQVRFKVVPPESLSSKEKEEDDGEGVEKEVGAAKLFEILEKEGRERGVEYYSVGRATLDQVFLEIVGRHKVMEEGHEEPGQRKERGGWVTKMGRMIGFGAKQGALPGS